MTSFLLYVGCNADDPIMCIFSDDHASESLQGGEQLSGADDSAAEEEFALGHQGIRQQQQPAEEKTVEEPEQEEKAGMGLNYLGPLQAEGRYDIEVGEEEEDGDADAKEEEEEEDNLGEEDDDDGEENEEGFGEEDEEGEDEEDRDYDYDQSDYEDEGIAYSYTNAGFAGSEPSNQVRAT